MLNPQELRKYAEEEVARTNKPKLTFDISDQILHELQVHQIELQMQNEELRRSQQALEEVRDRYFDLYEFAPVAYLTLTEQGLIQEINLTGETMLGVERQQLLQRRFAGFIDSDDTDRWHLFFAQQLKQKQRQTIDLTLKKPDQSVFFVKLDCMPLLNQDGLTLRIALTDISELIEARHAAEKASQVKSEFIASMNHEMRTPMNAVLGFAQLLKLDDLTEEQHKKVNCILTGGYHLMDLIKEVLDLAKIESEYFKLELEIVGLNSVVQSCIALVQPLVSKNQIQIFNQISTDNDVAIKASLLHFKQVLLNLISNAIKYNREGGSVTISCERVDSQRLRIKITDTGKGLSEEDVLKLFQPFERLSAKNSHIEGAGLGLVICKKLIEAMSGNIGVNCTVGKGCCFWIEIPLA